MTRSHWETPAFGSSNNRLFRKARPRVCAVDRTRERDRSTVMCSGKSLALLASSLSARQCIGSHKYRGSFVSSSNNGPEAGPDARCCLAAQLCFLLLCRHAQCVFVLLFFARSFCRRPIELIYETTNGTCMNQTKCTAHSISRNVCSD